SPAGAIHHPQEFRLDPAHAVEAERAAEAPMPGRVVSNGWTIRLVRHDRCLIVLGKDMPPLRRPARPLLAVAFELQPRLRLHAEPPIIPTHQAALPYRWLRVA